MTKRRANGEGSIYRHRDLWCGEILIDGKRRRVYERTQALAKVGLDALRERDAEEQKAGTGRQRLSTYLESWLADEVKINARLATYRIYKAMVDNHIISKIGHVQLFELTAQHVQTMLADLERESTSARLRQIIYAVLNQALKRAVDLDVVPRNACAKVKRPHADKPQIHAMTNEQRKGFLKAARSDRYYALYHVALSTGMRQGELLALQWSDVNLKQRRIAVRYTLTLDEKRAFVRTATKTGKGRVVELSAESVKALQKHQARLFAKGLRASPWVFPDSEGGPSRKDNLVKRSFQPILVAAGLPHFRFHDLRHSYASLALSAGVHPKVVQEMLGHSSIKMTLDTYSHLMPSMQRDAADLIGKLLG